MRWLRGWDSERALLAAVGGVLVLLLASATQAFFLLNAESKAQLATYQEYVLIDEALADLRRGVWMGVNHARDYLLQDRQKALVLFEGRLREMRRMVDPPMRMLEGKALLRDSAKGLREWYEDYERKLWSMPLDLAASGMTEAAFVQERLVPLRVDGLRRADELARSALVDLQQSEEHYRARWRNTAKRLLTTLVAALVAGLVVAFLSYRLLRRNRRERDLYQERIEHANRDLEQLSARLLEVQEEERRSFSRELHDEIGQTLTALRMEISQAQRVAVVPEARERLGRAREFAERAVRMVRDISLALRPPLLDDLGLGAALAWQVEEFGKRSGVRVEFQGEDVGEDLSDAVRTCVFRVAQESLHNCEKYALAKQVRVRLAASPQMLELEVRDDGVGFPMDERGMPPFGTGIIGMRERLVRIGGELEVWSRPRQGTIITARLPLRGKREMVESLKGVVN
jgi:signal transduction histidine kinase